MPTIVGTHHTSFTVAHVQDSVAFFRDMLGLELLFEREINTEYFGRIVGLPGCRVRAAMFRIPGSTHSLELFEYLEPHGRLFALRPCDNGSCHLALVVDDLPGFYENLRPHNLAWVSEPVPISQGPNSGGYAAYLRDPNGIIVELFQPPPQSQSITVNSGAREDKCP